MLILAVICGNSGTKESFMQTLKLGNWFEKGKDIEICGHFEVIKTCIISCFRRNASKFLKYKFLKTVTAVFEEKF